MNAPALRRALLDWYRRECRDLPWRGVGDPYAVWVSEIILQQTRVDQGTPYYRRFMKAFPDVAALAAAPEDAVLKTWEGLGYYARARNLHRAAKTVVRDLEGRLPENAESWRRLPGIGRYTAAAIASIAYGERVAVLDGNVKRVLARLCDIEACIDLPRTEAHLWEVAQGLVPAKEPGDFNQAMMELGARICFPKSPRCEVCPVASHCAALAAGTASLRPVRKARPPVPTREQIAAVIERNGRCLLVKRPAKGLLAGLWEFPSDDLRPGESHRQAIERIARDDLGIAVRPGGPLAVVRHAYSHFRVVVNVYRARCLRGTVEPVRHAGHVWTKPCELDQYPLPHVIREFLPLLLDRESP